jgi:hypothetical protein
LIADGCQLRTTPLIALLSPSLLFGREAPFHPCRIKFPPSRAAALKDGAPARHLRLVLDSREHGGTLIL